jgi:hypothetical protein
MGRYYWDKKDTVGDCKSVSISFLNRQGYLTRHSYGSGRIFWTNSSGEEIGSVGIVISTLESENYVRFHYTVTDRNSSSGFSSPACSQLSINSSYKLKCHCDKPRLSTLMNTSSLVWGII